VALSSLPRPLSRTADAAESFVSSALSSLWKYGVDAHFTGLRIQPDGFSMATFADSGFPLRTVPPQVFLHFALSGSSRRNREHGFVGLT
jgi:hypothetical protein